MSAMSGAMEWHAWLSSARLEPALVHEYALVLARNELEAGDAAYFDHDFLRSMGIDVAKHRLEILKLARPGPGERGRRSTSSSAAPLSGLVAAVGRVARYVRALVRLRGESSSSSTALVLVPSQQQQPDGHVDVGRSSFGRCKAPKRTRSM
uniref:SAM domain-containing protein n=2 Tax=Aegilops tauschii subsp. strangulata TaxID=200361 RepID=A0A453D919_AEGTS